MDALIVTIYKEKGDRSDCGNHRGISLLSIAGKILAKTFLNKLKKISENVLPERHCGFRAERFTSDMISSLRQLQERAVEQQTPLYMVFVDFSKAFDAVGRETLWRVIRIYGCPARLINMIRQFHDEISGRVSIGGDISQPFYINRGVKQGCVLAPTLFTLCLAAVLDTMSHSIAKGVYIHTRMDGKLFNLARPKARTKVRAVCIRDPLYADDSALVATDSADIQETVESFLRAAKQFGLKINTTKTELIF